MTLEEGIAARRRQRRNRRAKRGLSEGLKANKNSPAQRVPGSKKRKKRQSGNGPPSFASLPGAAMRIPDALKERGLHCRVSGTVLRDSTVASAHPAAFRIDKLIAGFPDRTMVELQRQWTNVLGLVEKNPKQIYLKFRDALIVEWERRYRRAVADPNHFVWPSTAARSGNGSLKANDWYVEGMLVYLGYRVGVTQGVSDNVRRQILDTVFAHFLPPINGVKYLREWGSPKTSERLRKLANEIASFARNAKRKRSVDMSSAIADWEADLNYLYRKYYVNYFRFDWPRL